MNTHAVKTQENKSQSVANEVFQKQNGDESTFQSVDNRPEFVAQRKLQEMANNSLQVSRLRAFQDMANNSPQVSQLRAFQNMANNSQQVKRAAQLQSIADNHSAQQQQLIQKKAEAATPAAEVPTSETVGKNITGLPDNLKKGMENLSRISLDDVKVHRNSDKPAQLQAHAYAQGTDIHLGPGQERHLPHEAWHVVQQKQGRVRPTMQMKGKVNVNNNEGLEKEADVMGEKAMQMKAPNNSSTAITVRPNNSTRLNSRVVQRSVGFEFETGWLLKAPANAIGMHTPVIEGTNWKVVPDRVDYSEVELREMGIGVGKTHVGSGSMEFVTDAFAENELGPGGGLDKTLQEIESVGNKLTTAPKAGGWLSSNLDTSLSNALGAGVSWGNHLSLPPHGRPGEPAFEAQLNKRENLLVRRIGDLASAPQMTGGIKLDQLIHVLEKMATGPGPAMPGQATPSSALMAQSDPLEVTIQAECVRRAKIIAGRRVEDGSISPGQRAAFEGILAILGSYICLAQAYGNNIAYDKGIAPLLSRTDFGGFPGWATRTLWFEEDVLLSSGGRYAGENELNVAEGNDNLFVKPRLHAGLTTSAWIKGIIEGKDKLDWGQDRTNANWNPQMVGMPGNQAEGHVYEFRRLVNPLPFNQWRQFTLDMASLVVLANQGNLQ
jgi:hypothetical protein